MIMVSSPSNSADAVLPPHTNKYRFRSFHDFRSILSYEARRLEEDPTSSQFVVFTHLTPTILNDNFRQQTRDIICYIIDSYSPQKEELVIKMKTGAHEAAHRVFDNIVLEKLVLMNQANRKLLPVGAKTLFATHRSKEADTAYRPLDLLSGRSIDWPTLAMESGYTASAETLSSNASWWFDASAGDVNIVVTIDIDRKNKHVNFKKYERLDDGSIHEQLVTVTPAGVSGSPMVFAFHLLLLSNPTADETDIAFTRADFEYMGKAIWKEQFR